MQPRPAAAHALDEQKLRRAARHAVYGAQALGGDAGALHGAQHFQRARGGKDHAQSPAVFEQLRRAFGHVRRAEVAFVPRQAHALVLAGQRRARAPVGGIAHRQRVFTVAEKGVRVAHIPGKDAHAIFQTVQKHAAARHVRHVRLQFHRVHAERRLVRGHQRGDGPGAATQIHGARARPGRGKVRQQHRIRAEAEGVRALDEAVAAALQVIQPLAGQKQFRERKVSTHRCSHTPWKIDRRRRRSPSPRRRRPRACRQG